MNTPSVVVLLLDTLRYDYAMTLPAFRFLSERGWNFTRMYGGSTFTFPNLCTIRSGMYPCHHKRRTWPKSAAFEAKTTLEECLSDAGYRIDMGMEVPPPHESRQLIRGKGGPFFRFCWWMGIHDCVFSSDVKGVPARRYKHCVSGCEHWLKRALPMFDDCLMLVLGDHGIGLGENLLDGEGIDVGAGQVYDFRIRVPCVLAGPMLEPRTIDSVHSLADLMPTILSILNLPIPGGLDGRPVGMRLEPVFLEAQSPYSIWKSDVPNVFGATDGRIKVMATPAGWLAFDLVYDPGEDDNRPDLLETPRGNALKAIVRKYTTEEEWNAIGQLTGSNVEESVRVRKRPRTTGAGQRRAILRADLER